MTPPRRALRARLTAAALWTLLWLAIATVVVMTWHPWVIGERRDCAPPQRIGWDGRCH